MQLRSIIGLLLLGATCAHGVAFAYTSPGVPVGYVNDFAALIDEEEQSQLELQLSEVAKGGNEIAIATINTLEGDDIESYANNLFREWGVGGVESNRGILIVIAKEEREVRIEVGYGLEGEVPDVIANRIIDSAMVPELREDQYGKAMLAGVAALLAELEVEGVQVAQEPVQLPAPEEWWYILMFAYVGFSWVIGILSRTKEWVLGGALGGGVSLLIGVIFGLSIGLAVAVPLVLIGLVVDYVVSQGYRDAIRQGRTPPWWTGGTFGGGGGGYRGGGGFGGFGGGSSGGGGASGRF